MRVDEDALQLAAPRLVVDRRLLLLDAARLDECVDFLERAHAQRSVLLELLDARPEPRLDRQTVGQRLPLRVRHVAREHAEPADNILLRGRSPPVDQLLALDLYEAAREHKVPPLLSLVEPLVVNLDQAELLLNLLRRVVLSKLEVGDQVLGLVVVLGLELVPLDVIAALLRLGHRHRRALRDTSPCPGQRFVARLRLRLRLSSLQAHLPDPADPAGRSGRSGLLLCLLLGELGHGSLGQFSRLFRRRGVKLRLDLHVVVVGGRVSRRRLGGDPSRPGQSGRHARRAAPRRLPLPLFLLLDHRQLDPALH